MPRDLPAPLPASLPTAKQKDQVEKTRLAFLDTYLNMRPVPRAPSAGEKAELIKNALWQKAHKAYIAANSALEIRITTSEARYGKKLEKALNGVKSQGKKRQKAVSASESTKDTAATEALTQAVLNDLNARTAAAMGVLAQKNPVAAREMDRDSALAKETDHLSSALKQARNQSERVAKAVHKVSDPTQRARLIAQLEAGSAQIRTLEGRIAQIASYRDASDHRLDLIADCEKEEAAVSRKLKEYHERLIKEAIKPENLEASNADKDWSENKALVDKIEKARTRVDIGARLFSDKTDVTMISEAQFNTLSHCMKVGERVTFSDDRDKKMGKIADEKNAPDQRTARLALRETALSDLRGMRSALNADPVLRAYRTNPFDGATGWHQMVTTLNVIETDLLKTLAA